MNFFFIHNYFCVSIFLLNFKFLRHQSNLFKFFPTMLYTTYIHFIRLINNDFPELKRPSTKISDYSCILVLEII